MDAEREIEARLLEAGIDAALASRLGTYGAMLLEATGSVNLTAARTPEALVPHFLDSLSLVPHVRGPLVDIGSGGGLPGIPVALAAGQPVTLIEAVAKKARFLDRALASLGLAGEVRAGRAEVLAHDAGLRGRFLAATARAVASAPTVAELTLPFVAPRGVALLQRGAMDDAEREALAGASLMLGGAVRDEDAVGGDRRIVIVEKREATPDRFPRRNGVPEKRPLCLHG